MKLKEISGQKKASELLEKAIHGNRINHAYLFYGPKESGKFTFSLMAAKMLNCLKGNACGTCISCRKVDRGIHPDVSVVSPEGKNIKIEQIRQLKNLSSFKPNEGRKKVYIFQEAHKMSLPAANSLLAVLEEPPDYIVFILLVPELFLLPDTVVSRCQCIPFGRVSRKEIYNVLKVQKPHLSQEKLQAAAHAAEGSILRAIKLAGSEDWNQWRHSSFQWWKGFLHCKSRELFSYGEQLAQEENLIEFLDFIESYYRDCLVYGSTGEEDLIINIDYLEEIKKIEVGSSRLLIKAIEELESFKRKLSVPLNKKNALEAMLVKMKGVK
ncbi:DNA polymerase III subunit [Candidatus Contubernalis alkaliaceticus]|uniref:DNA polymerase III subunit n=1 Tax=Candidatus Contubernalis alkaliaceticus TaxID=338645 RepID=UPI001F4BD346|nr:DNA polymerase III subunit delta' [Candidatus Contubernalis alkalaceticus]UNC90675.1 DNA polymerase III subunit delta' [Candidatus Contubernalis alkalaceticus]